MGCDHRGRTGECLHALGLNGRSSPCRGLVAEGFVADAAFVDGSHIFHRVFVDLAFLHETRTARRTDHSR